MASRVKLTDVMNFHFVEQDSIVWLECPKFNDLTKAYRIAVETLSDRDALIPRKSWCCCSWGQPEWIQFNVIVDGRNQSVFAKVQEIARKWGLEESVVRENDLPSLATTVLQRTRTLPADKEADDEGDLKEPSTPLNESIWNQFGTFLGVAQVTAAISQTVALIKANWGCIKARIESEKESWENDSSLTSEHQIHNLFGMDVGYCGLDHSIWLYLNCGRKYPLALEYSTGLLYQFINIGGQPRDVYERFAQIAQQNPNIEKIRVAVEKDTARVLKPFFYRSLYTAQERGSIKVNQQEALVQGWRAGLEALHKEGIVHGEISADSLLLQSQLDRSLLPLVGYSQTASSEANMDALIAKDWSDFNRCIKKAFPSLRMSERGMTVVVS